jgi:hypothetical protein
MSKQTAVQLIFEKFNLLSDAEFKSWMLMNSELLEAKEKQQIIDAVDDPKYMESHITAHNVPGISSSSMGWFMNGRQYYEINYGGNK